MDALRAEAWEYIKVEPAGFAKRTVKKIVWFWTLAPARFVRSSEGGEALRFRWLYAGYWLALLLLAAAGWLRGRAVPREYLAVLALYAIVYSVTYGVTHVGQARHRGEMEFILVPLAAAGLSRLLASARPKTRNRAEGVLVTG